MNKCILEMPSYTYAQKAAKLLRSRDISAEVRRRSTGCGYTLHIRADCRKAAGILDKYGIPYILGESGAPR
ncbi:MAG: DUF3343 domain-containing protein [Ruminococcus sp.]|jgi:hypothetical protein|nr:DUF3343 domain-containing protein [Ruminococcus sp.]MCR5075955.1 DUF3343 domain-containing protein [Ruminococcus sp.]